MRILRSKRVRTPGIEAWLCTETAQLVNISATGALVRSDALLPEGRECPLVLHTYQPVRLRVRIVWAKPLATKNSPANGDEEYLLALRFTQMPPSAKAVVSALRGSGPEKE